MAKLTTSQIYALARGAGFSAAEAATATAIALAESSGDPAAVGDTGIQTAKWGPSVGLWQVRTLKAEKGKGTIRDESWLLASPANQAKAAFQIRHGSGGWGNWSVYSNGKYRSNLTAVETTVGKETSSGGDSWWSKLLGVGGWVDVVSPRGDGQTHIGAAAETVQESASAVEQAGRFLETVNSPEFWKRVGIGAAGALVILVAVLVMVWAGKDKILKSTVGTVVSSVAKGK